MSKTQLIKTAKISTYAMARMAKNEDVRVETLVKTCSVLGRKANDITDYISEKMQRRIRYENNRLEIFYKRAGT